MGIQERRFAVHRNLIVNLAYFCALLRDNGVNVGTSEEITALRCLEKIDLQQRPFFRGGLSLALVKSQEEQAIFDRLFDSFWMVFGQIPLITKTKETWNPSKKNKIAYRQKTTFLTVSDWIQNGRGEITEDREAAAYSPFEALTDVDFSEIPEQAIASITRQIIALSRKIPTCIGRRYVPTKRAKRADTRRIVAEGLKNGEVGELFFRRKKPRNVRFTLLLDVSKSMEIYSSFLLSFMFALRRVSRRSEFFVFSTDLLQLDKGILRGNFDNFREQLQPCFPKWSGGTRIGECFAVFERRYAPTVLDTKTVLVILSDGWDCGNVDELSGIMQRLRAQVSKVIWLNPLAGFTGYRPETAGMKACLPFIDEFHAAHNYRSLAQAFKKITK